MAIVEVDNLSKRYKGAQTNAVDSVSFSIEPGEFFAMLGPNGAGKTTTISILTTTLAPTAGSVHVGGHDVSTARSCSSRSGRFRVACAASSRSFAA